MYSRLFKLLFGFLIALPTWAQQSAINGFVLDQSNSAPLHGAVIIGYSDTTLTDHTGYFELMVARRSEKITIAHLGYEPYSAEAESDTPIRILMTPSNLELNQVVVTAGITESRIINSPASISLITPLQLQRDDPFSITNSLNRTPGVYMHSGTLNTNRITIRGMGSRSLFATDKIKAYYDQIPLTDGSGNSTIEDLDQSLIQRIEVIKGPNSSIFGAGLGGVINISSIKPEFRKTTFETSLTLGLYNTYRWANNWNHSDDRLLLSVVHSDVGSDGWRDNSEYSKTQTGVVGRYYFDNGSHFNFLGIYTDLKAQIPSSIDSINYFGSPKNAASNWAEAQGYEDYKKTFSGLSYHYSPIGNLHISHAVNLQTKNSYEAAISAIGIMDEEAFGFSTRNILEWQISRFKSSVGFEWFKDKYQFLNYQNLYTPESNGSVQGDLRGELLEDRSYLNGFAEVIFFVNDRLIITSGINVNSTNYELTDKFNPDSTNISGSYSYNPIVSPRLGAVYHFNENTHWFTNASHGFSQPTLEQTLNPDQQINPDIKPETGWNFETGMRGNIKNLSYDLSVHYMRIENLLVDQRLDASTYIGVNAGANDHFGIESYIDYTIPISDGTFFRAYSSLAYMYYKFDEFVWRDNDFGGNDLTGVPRLTINSGLELVNETGLYGNINSQYVSKIPITDANDIYADEYHVIRLKAGYKKTFGAWKVNVYAGVNNLTNEHYASMLLINPNFHKRYYYPGLPRNYFGGVSVGYVFK